LSLQTADQAQKYLLGAYSIVIVTDAATQREIRVLASWFLSQTAEHHFGGLDLPRLTLLAR
jgi:hypothetical protein